MTLLTFLARVKQILLPLIDPMISRLILKKAKIHLLHECTPTLLWSWKLSAPSLKSTSKLTSSALLNLFTEFQFSLSVKKMENYASVLTSEVLIISPRRTVTHSHCLQTSWMLLGKPDTTPRSTFAMHTTLSTLHLVMNERLLFILVMVRLNGKSCLSDLLTPLWPSNDS